MNITAMIPARMGSQRLAHKNLALLNGNPMISYAITAAQNASLFTQIVVNSDSRVFRLVAKRYGVDFYLRSSHLGQDHVKADHVVADFLHNHPCDVVVWVNPIAPLQTGADIRTVVEAFIAAKANSMVTVTEHRVHALYKQQPVNFSSGTLFERTQDLEPVCTFAYSVMAWTSKTFLHEMDAQGTAVLHGQCLYPKVSKPAGLIVKTKEDLAFADAVLRMRNSNYTVMYDPILDLVP